MQRLNDAVLLIGRLLVAALFLPSGIHKALGFDGFATMLAGKGLPFAQVVAGVGVAVEILVPVMLILGLFPRIAALLLIGFTVVATLLAHQFWTFPEAQQQAQMINFYKNAAIIGGLLFYFVSGPGAWSLSGRSPAVATPAATPAPAQA